MTVLELINVLRTLPPNAEAVILDESGLYKEPDYFVHIVKDGDNDNKELMLIELM